MKPRCDLVGVNCVMGKCDGAKALVIGFARRVRNYREKHLGMVRELHRIRIRVGMMLHSRVIIKGE